MQTVRERYQFLQKLKIWLLEPTLLRQLKMEKPFQKQ